MRSRFQRKNQRKSRKLYRQYAGSDDKFCQSLNHFSGKMNDADDKEIEGLDVNEWCNHLKKPDECPLQQMIKYNPEWKEFYESMKQTELAPYAPNGYYRSQFNKMVRNCANYDGNDEDYKQFCKAFVDYFDNAGQLNLDTYADDTNLKSMINDLNKWANEGLGNENEPMCRLCMGAESDAFINEFSSKATVSDRKKYLSERASQCSQAAQQQGAGKRRRSKRASYRRRM